MSLPTFKDENEFRQTWIKPFLRKIGCILVTHTHGPDEHGKDLIFADFDRFEHPRYCAVQAKKGDIGAGGIELLKLREQIQACFDVRVRDRKGAEDQRISAVYVMASGTISSAARTRLCGHFRSERYGENVYFLDGDRLETLNKFAAYRTDQDARSLLAALLRETDFNLRRLSDLAEKIKLPGQTVVTHFRVAAVEQALATTLPADLIPYEQVEWVWNALELVNALIDYGQIVPPTSHQDLNRRISIGRTAQNQCQEFRTHLLEAQRRLDERYDLRVDVVDENRAD